MKPLLLILACSIPLNEALNAYLYYKDAQCTDSETISGSYTLSYDDSDYDAYGFELEYEGPCLHYVNGYLDVDDFDWEADLYGIGYCVECNGYVGCSTDQTCDNFMTYPPPQQTSSYQLTLDNTDNVQQQQQQPLNKSLQNVAMQLQADTMKQLQSYGTASDHTARYVILGAFIGMVTLFGLLAILEGARQIRERNRYDSNHLSQHLTHNEQVDHNTVKSNGNGVIV